MIPEHARNDRRYERKGDAERFLALAALTRRPNRHLDTVSVRGRRPPAGALRLRDDRQVWRCAVASWVEPDQQDRRARERTRKSHKITVQLTCN